MASDWEEMRLDEVTELIIDCPHSTPKWMDEGVAVLRSNNIKNGRLDLSSPSFTNEEGYQARVKRAIPESGDLVLTREAPMGEVCQIPEGLRCCLGQRMVLLRVKKEIMDSTFLLFTLQSPYLQHQISWNEGTGTTVSNIRIPNIKAFQIPTPPLAEQKAIAHILGALDDKIELNRQMNETLEAMAQALFKSWFVDFDPVIDNAQAAGNDIPDEMLERAEQRKGIEKKENSDIQSLFPDEFEVTEEMGWIPKGWESITLGDFAILGNGKTSPDRAVGDIPVFGSNGKIGDCDESNRDNTIIIGRVGSYCGSLQYYPSKCWITDNAMSAEMKNKDHNIYLFQLLSRDNLNDRRTGSGQPLLNQSILRSIKTVMPSVFVIDEYSKIANSFYKKIDKNNGNNEALAKLRDTLLPKLMSGELRIPDAVALADDVL